MIHWCPEETAAVIAGLAAIKMLGPYIRAKLTMLAYKIKQRKRPHCCNEDHHV